LESQVEKVSLNLQLNQAEDFVFTSVPNNCLKAAQNINYKLTNILSYEISYKIDGANETLESFGNLPLYIK
jgi:hypothetical protein